MLFENGFELENTSNKPRVIYMTLYAESAAHQTDHFANAFVCENVAYSYDVEKITIDAILFGEIQCKKRKKRNILTAFSVLIWLK